MRRSLSITFPAIIFMLMVSLAQAKDKKDPKPILDGAYVGIVEVYNSKGSMMTTDVRLEIRKGTKKYYIMEMYYFESTVAQFTRCARIGPNRLNISEKTVSEGKTVRVEGSIYSDKGKFYQGRIRYHILHPDGGMETYRTFKLKRLRPVKGK